LVEDFDECGFLGIQAESFREGIVRRYGKWFDLCHDINSFAQKAKFELVSSCFNSRKNVWQ